MRLQTLTLFAILSFFGAVPASAMRVSLPTAGLAQANDDSARGRFDALVEQRRNAEEARREAAEKLEAYAFSQHPPAHILAEYENAIAACDRLDRKLMQAHILNGYALPNFTADIPSKPPLSTGFYGRAESGLVRIRAEAAARLAKSLPELAPLPHPVRAQGEGAPRG